jgi:hypothetical protein
MILHSKDECEQWITYRGYHGVLTKSMFFDVRFKDYDHYILWNVADILGKGFQHNEAKIVKNINQIIENYPPLKTIVENLHIFMCPKPSADTCNACANGEYIVYFARSTQIPNCMTDYITGHELGHSVQCTYCPSIKDDAFMKYLELRKAQKGICSVRTGWDENDDGIYEDMETFYYVYGTQEEKRKYHGDWDTSPLEWFAEDFRYLFGVDKGEPYWGLPIDPPDEKIRDFMLSLGN